MRVNLSEKFPENDRIARIRLIRSRHVGAVTFHRLIERFGTADAALDALPAISARAGNACPRICTAAEARRERDAAEKAGARLVFHGEPGYPPLLAMTEDAPAYLSVRGNVELLGKKAVAVVGARNASCNGQQLAQSLAADLGRAGLLVVSGLALGIDAAAHRGALASGTLAVLGGGIDITYPRQNRGLHDAIAEAGVLVSEVRPGEKPTARHFPRRNRIISGIARGVIVVEASLRSGSLITARLAAEQGRDVFAVPGAAHDPRGRGTNQLLRDGAILTETADDVLRAWDGGWQGRQPPRPRAAARRPASIAATSPRVEPPTEEDHGRIISALSTVPSDIDDVLRHTGIDTEQAQILFTELELAGRLERHPGGKVSLRANI